MTDERESPPEACAVPRLPYTPPVFEVHDTYVHTTGISNLHEGSLLEPLGDGQ
jgi:hypothetical protein